MNILETCQYYEALGFRALPASREKKSPLGAWGKYRNQTPTLAELAALASGADAVCILTGGRVEVLDFDDEATFLRWKRLVPGELFGRLLIERTKNGGFHVVYFCDRIEGNQKLAKAQIVVSGPGEWPTGYGTKKLKARAVGEQWVIEPVLAETRGEGGLIICAPTEGYRWLSSMDLMDCPTLYVSEREMLLGAARGLSSVPVTEKPRSELSGKAPDLSGSPYPQDQYSWNVELEEIVEMLEEAGWTRVGEDDKRIRFARPGKEDGTSGTLTKDRAFTFWNFSDNGDLPTGRGILAFDLAVAYRFNNDRNAALEWIEKRFPVRGVDNLTKVEDDQEVVYPPTPAEAMIQRINESHALTTIGGKAVVIRELDDRLDLLKRYDFETIMLPHKVLVSSLNAKGETVQKLVPASKVWLESADRRESKGICFSPSGCPDGWTNMWRGFAVEPKQNDSGFDRYKWHVEHIICGGNKALAHYVWAWLADIIQNPGNKPGVCIALTGGRGVGKGTFVLPMLKILGRHAIQIQSRDLFIGRFNGHMADKIFVFLDEAYWHGDKSAEGKLKGFITESTLPIEQKGVDAFTVDSYHRVLIASNEDHVVPAGMDERRFLVIKVKDTVQQDHNYFAAIDKEMKNGGVEALMSWLGRYDYSDVNLRKAPTTKALAEQKLESMPPHIEWWHECLERGSIDRNELGWPEFIRLKEVHGEYLLYCKTNNHTRHTLSERKLNTAIFSEGAFCPKTGVKIVDNSYRIYAIPSLQNCREIFCQKFRFDNIWAEGYTEDRSAKNRCIVDPE